MDLTPYFKYMAERKASDLFISAGAPIYIKIEGELKAANKQPLTAAQAKEAIYGLMTEAHRAEFEREQELNFGFSVQDLGRFRVNVFYQRGSVALVVRFIQNTVPTIEALHLPPVLGDLALEKRGLVLVVGATGSGKSTTLASMLDYRNTHRAGHILTVEDPIEFVHKHKRSIVNQREVGVDTKSFNNALINAMREAPDVLMIGEIRDENSMRQAMIYTQTGHLCLATLHANNAYHALTRIVSFFPPESREHHLHDLSVSLKAIISQRLVRGLDGKRIAATEILQNSLHVAELIIKQDVDAIKEAMERSMVDGTQTFEQALYYLYKSGKISLDEALSNADSRTNLEWLIKNTGKDNKTMETMMRNAGDTKTRSSFENITIMPEMLNQGRPSQLKDEGQ